MVEGVHGVGQLALLQEPRLSEVDRAARGVAHGESLPCTRTACTLRARKVRARVRVGASPNPIP